MRKNDEILLYLKKINELIKKEDTITAKKLLEKTNTDEFNEYRYYIRHLNAKINELSKTEKELTYLTYAKISLDKRRYEDALSVFYEGLITTKNNIFNYYVGRALYKMGYQLEALPYLKKYVKNGGFKLSNALLLITIIFRNHHLRKESAKYIKNCQKINDFNNSNYKLTDFDYHIGEYKLLKKDK